MDPAQAAAMRAASTENAKDFSFWRPGDLGKLRTLVLALAGPLAMVGCGGGTTPGDSDGGVITDGGAFNDHTVLGLASTADFDTLARTGPSTRSVEFIIEHFSDNQPREVRFLDGTFYSLHDEWYWYRLLNGQAIPSDDGVTPVRGFHFNSIQLIYSWARQTRSLPLDLTWVTNNERLYSPRFYEISLGQRPRKLALGTLVHVPARAPAPERWAFELEYTHDIQHEELVTYFAELEHRVPAEIFQNLKWLVRSPQQETVAAAMEAGHLQYWDRILRYKELSVPGAREVYSSGITAGRLRVVRATDSLEDTSPEDILLLEQTPDFLPPCTGLITAVPQTPLAHVNFLARNRGIPNVYLGGSLDDPNIDQLARVRAPVILRGELPDQAQLVPITEQEYAMYRNLGAKPPLAVTPPDLTGVANIYDLATLSVDEVDHWRPIVGGKCAGMLQIISTPNITHPDKPMAISIKPYLEHLQQFRPRLEEMLRTTDFVNDARTRYLTLEGADDYDLVYTSDQDQTYKANMLERYPVGSVLGDFMRGKGVRGAIRAAPMNAATLADITAAITAQYPNYDVHQGLRFRSSSNAEDIEGFNGAGLYDSNTGFINAAAQLLPDDQKKTLEYGIKKTWASYWASEAFEERRLENVNHLSGAMGVLVHARFEDEKERANGVFTLTIQPKELTDAKVFEINVQKGALSVTNPVPGDPNIPEIDRVHLPQASTTPTIERVRRSTLSTDADLLSDAQLLELFGEAQRIGDAWLNRLHAKQTPEQAQRTLTLDFEFRYVADNWPAVSSGTPFTTRLVVKQARSLDPGVRGRTPALDPLPFPKDLRARAARIERRICLSGPLQVQAWELYSDPLIRPDLSYSVKPFTALVAISALQDLPDLGLVRGATLTATHLDFDFSHPDGGWGLHLGVHADHQAAVGFDALDIGVDKSLSVTKGAGSANTTWDSCNSELLFASPKAYLVGLLAAH
ncbi:MAG: PEP/pyruvate-binding domain-containing protein [Myxococcota bacterium]